ncbi:DUF2591 family protein [Edwardsiella ictaluri]|nr:DUF2591 family protein [Edwardsiella ictaluri]
MNYAEMSDFEINRAVFMATGIYYEDIMDGPIGGGSAIPFGDGCKWREYDFCNNPADMWPLIVENGIAILPYGRNGLWMAAAAGVRHHHKNPLRAAATVYLMMKEAGK